MVLVPYLRILSTTWSQILFLFSSESFIVAVLTFKSLIHLKFIYIYMFCGRSPTLLLHVDTQLSQHHFSAVELSFFIRIYLLYGVGGEDS
jgi:hypothetical protein